MQITNEFKDDSSKQLIKLSAHIKSFNSTLFFYKPTLHLKHSSLHCLEVVVFKKSDNLFFCAFNFVCNTNIIYLEDYNKLFTGKKFNTDNESIKEFEHCIKELINFIHFVYDKDKNPWKFIVLTSTITENFEIITKVGFNQDAILNHYGNTRFKFSL